MSRSSGSISNHSQLSQDNETLEEDMRKAKESADLLKSVVLPLETELSNLKIKLELSQKKIYEYEAMLGNKAKDSTVLLKLNDNFIENNDDLDENKLNFELNNEYRLLREQLNVGFHKFMNAEIKNVDLINEIFSILNDEQKAMLINSLKPRLLTDVDSSDNSNNNTDNSISEVPEDINEHKFLETVNIVTVPQSHIDEMIAKFDTLMKISNIRKTNEKTKRELKILYETEKKYREEIEKTLNEKAIESQQRIELLNRDIVSLETIINEVRGKYIDLQNQFQQQIDGFVKMNEDIKIDVQDVETENEKLKKENLKLRTENKQFYGERSLILQEFEKDTNLPQNVEELQKLILKYRDDIINLTVANEALIKKNEAAGEAVKELKKVNYQIRTSSSIQDQLVISQSLESELDRERKVRNEIESDLKQTKSQIKVLKDKSQSIIESLRKRNEQNELDIEKLKTENQEFSNQIQALKRDMKNNHSVQEDLVKLNQSLQIELEQTRASETEIRMQHEEDFTECIKCKSSFGVTRRKNRCRHCCKIYCADCLNKTVYTGPNMRASKICDNCFMILDKVVSQKSKKT